MPEDRTGETIGPYRVESKLGEGGMGEVYRARDTKLNRDVAIKVLPATVAADPDRLARFSREAQTLAALNHPNIAAIYGIEEFSGGRALVMELVFGGRPVGAHRTRRAAHRRCADHRASDCRGARGRARSRHRSSRPQAGRSR